MGKASRWTRSPILPALIITLAVVAGVILLRNTGNLQFLELAAYDVFVRLKADNYDVDDRITVIAITEEDIQEMKEWPLSDATLARLLDAVASMNPRAIGLDIYRDIPVPPGEQSLTAVFDSNQNIVTVQKIGDADHPGVPPPYVLNDYSLVGFADSAVDSGDTVRRGVLFIDDGETVYNSFSLLLSLLYLSADGIYAGPDDANPDYVRIGETTFVPFESHDGGYVRADARGYQFLLDYRGADKPFPTYTLSEVFSGGVNPEDLREKIVLIGVTAESVKDFFTVPLSSKTGERKKMYGVELHAHVASQIVRSAVEGSTVPGTLKESREVLLILVWGLLGGVLGLRMRSLFVFIGSLAVSLAALAAGSYGFFLSGWWIPSVPPAIAFLGSSGFVTALMAYRERAERSSLMKIFSRHVSKDIAEAIWEQRDAIMDNGRPVSRQLTATVLFTDLRGFTTISERMQPSELMDWLNEYMGAMTGIITAHGGVINKYIGDAIMGIFGVPLPRTGADEISRDAVQAIDSALEMEKELERLNVLWAGRGLPTTQMRVGIYTGPLVAGCVGSSERMEYTVIGDTVNISSRLESFKGEGLSDDVENRACRILIGESTLRYLGDRYDVDRVGEVSLKGKELKITVYSVRGRKQAPGVTAD